MPTLPLEPDDVAALRDLPRAFAARQLLTGARGPIGAAGFDATVADAAYFAFVAYGFARRGMLAGRPGYEATATLGSRIRTAGTRARSLESWGHELLRGLHLRANQLRADDLLWWRGTCALDAEGALWQRIRDRDHIQDVVSAAGILVSDGWLWDLYKGDEA